jgi:adenine-specific DNA-methyltransferase
MPTLDWLNRPAAYTTAAQVPYRLLDTVSTHGDAAQAQQNLLIQGDNLQALKALLPFYRGKVKCIFIDPPYNTQSAFEHYDDNLEHSQWLSMMLPRLQLLRELLSEDGSIWVTIDDNEGHYLKVLMDEVFGRRNFLTTFIWQKSYGGGAKARYFVGLHEYIHCFAKNIAALPDFFWPPDEGVLKYYKLRDAKFVIRGPYRLQPLATTSNDERPNLRYALPGPDGTEVWPVKQWQWSRERALNALANDELVFTPSKTGFTVNYKQYLRDTDGEERRAKPKSIIEGQYTQHGTQESVALFGQEKKFSFPKPEGIIERILEAATTPGDLVLDSFLGSGTTAAVAHKMGRRWIGIEMGEHAATHCLPRLEKVIAGEPGGISQAVGWQGGGGFRFARLGAPVFDAQGCIHPEVRFATLAAFVWQQETGTAFDPAQGRAGTPWLGTHSVFDSFSRLPDAPEEAISIETAAPEPVLRSRTAYYLLFNGILGDKRPASGNVLTRAVLDALLQMHASTPHPEAPLVVYGEANRLGPETLARARVTFRHIPYDVKAR